MKAAGWDVAAIQLDRAPRSICAADRRAGARRADESLDPATAGAST